LSHGDALARERFSIPQGVIYLDGNSLGAMPKATPERLRALMREEWRSDLIASWTKHGWIDLPMTVAAKLAPILGAKASELLVVDSTSVSLFKLLGAAVRARPGRTTILTQRHNFPTDLYVAQGLADMLGMALKTVAADEIAEAIDESVAVVTLTHVDYRSGASMAATAIWPLAAAINISMAGPAHQPISLSPTHCRTSCHLLSRAGWAIRIRSPLRKIIRPLGGSRGS